MEIDITQCNDGIHRIKFCREVNLDGYQVAQWLAPSCNAAVITIVSESECINICFDTIDNLIKALQKAKEIWA